MSDFKKGHGANLTGVWQGVYSYRNGQPIPFWATLIESGSFLTGTTQENTTVGARPDVVANAMIDGTRQASRVAFVKTYDGAAGWTHSIAYDGAVNGDATEIEGAWRLPEGISGRFFMRREAGKAKEVEIRRLAEVDN